MRSDGAIVLQGDTRRLPLRDESVDLIVTSPPYFSLRDYGVTGQIGTEPTPAAFLTSLWLCAHEWWRVLKPEGSCWVNLGDKRSGSVGPGTTTGFTTLQGTPQQQRVQGERSGIRGSYKNAGAYGRPKSKMLLPHRFAIGCEDGSADPDGVGWIVRQDEVWWKPNGLPESVRDRTRDSHEYWFHLTKQGDYYQALDEIREPLRAEVHPLGKLPDSVREVPTEPLQVPDSLGVEHFAAFPTEWPRWLILGWSPHAICTRCGRGRWPVTELAAAGRERAGDQPRHVPGYDDVHRAPFAERVSATIVGYACDCTPYTDYPERRGSEWIDQSDRLTSGRSTNSGDRSARWRDELANPRREVREYDLGAWDAAPTRPAVVLDPFGGTGTTAMVARALGRLGVSVDLSADYGRLARWRIFDSGHGARVIDRTNAERQGSLL